MRIFADSPVQEVVDCFPPGNTHLVEQSINAMGRLSWSESLLLDVALQYLWLRADGIDPASSIFLEGEESVVSVAQGQV